MPGSRSAQAPRSPILVIDASVRAFGSARAQLCREARSRGWKVVELDAGDHYPEIDALAGKCGADVVGFVGVDRAQSKATVVASGRGLPFTCVPAGGDDQFARDLGVDPDDEFGALVAIENYCEYDVDLAEVNGVTFVNYAALGLDCSPVHSRTPAERAAWPFANLASYTVTCQKPAVPLHWFGTSGRESCEAIFVSNNRRRFASHTIGARTRLDGGLLGIGVLRATRCSGAVPERALSWLELGLPDFEVDSTVALALDLDGQTVSLEPPIRFRILPRALRVRVPSGR